MKPDVNLMVNMQKGPELGAGVPKVNLTGEGEGAICAPSTWKEGQWCGALVTAAEGVACNPIHGRPHRWG